MAVTVAKMVAYVGALTGDAEKGLRAFSRSFEGTARRTQQMGDDMSRYISLPLLAAGGASVKFAADFNGAMANVASLGAEARASVGQWKPMVQDLAVSVGKGTGDMADGLYQVVSAFGVAGDTMAVLESNARLAAGGLSSTTEAINLTSAVTKAYGDTSAAAVDQVADLAIKTVQLGQTTFPELAGSIGRVAPLASTLGVSMEELFGVMATGTGVTGSAAEVSTQLRGVLQGLMAPTADMTALYSELGYASGAAMLDQMGLQDTIAAIVQAAEGSNTPLQKYIGSIEGQTLALALAGPQAETFGGKLMAMGEAAGAADEAFRAQTEGVNEVGFELQQVATRAQVAAEQFGDGLAPAAMTMLDITEPLLEQVSDLATAFAEMEPGMQKAIVGMGALAVGAGPALSAFGRLTAMTGSVSGFMGAVGKMPGFLRQAGAGMQLMNEGAGVFAVMEQGGGAAAASMGMLSAGLVVAAAAAVALYDIWRRNEEGVEGSREVFGSFYDEVVAGGASAAEVLKEYEGAISRVQAAYDAGNPVVRAFVNLNGVQAEALAGLSGALGQTAADYGEYAEMVAQEAEAAGYSIRQTEAGIEAYEVIGGVYVDASDKLNILSQAEFRSAQGTVAMNAELSESAREFNDAARAADESSAAIEAAAESTEAAAEETLGLTESLSLVKEAYGLGLLGTEAYVTALEQARAGTLEMTQAQGDSMEAAILDAELRRDITDTMMAQAQAAGEARMANLELAESYRAMSNAEMAVEMFNQIQAAAEADGVVTEQEAARMRALGLELGALTESGLAWADTSGLVAQAVLSGVIPLDQAREASDAYNLAVRQGGVDMEGLLTKFGATEEGARGFLESFQETADTAGQADTNLTNAAGAVDSFNQSLTAEGGMVPFQEQLRILTVEDLPAADVMFKNIMNETLNPFGVTVDTLANEKLPGLAGGFAEVMLDAGSAELAVIGLGTAIEELPSSKSIDIQVNMVGGGMGGVNVDDTKKYGAFAANGIDFVVPQGFQNDSLPVWVSSGERVIVQTPSQQERGVDGGINLTNNGTMIFEGGGMSMDEMLEKMMI